MAKICQDGRIWGQNNKEAGDHLGILTGRRHLYKSRIGAFIGLSKIVGTKCPICGLEREKNHWQKHHQQGENNSRYGKYHSEEWKRKRKENCFKGSKHPSWKGGISKTYKTGYYSTEYKKWRKDVFERDNYTCVICGQVGGKINAHHIKSFAKYPELRFDVNNGITICLKCHYIGRKETPLFFL